MTAPALNPEMLAQLAEDLPAEVLVEVARRYAADCEATLAAMAAALTDATAWQRAAHRLAGGAGTVGAQAVEARARALMSAPLPANPAAVLAELRAACQESAAAFTAWAAAR